MKYIKTYKIYEGHLLYRQYSSLKKSDIEDRCKFCGIKNYTVNDDLTVDVNGDVDLSYKKLIDLPIKFNKVMGSFYCGSNNLTTLYGCPKWVGYTFDCQNNPINTLEYCPKYIGGTLNCSGTLIKDLSHLSVPFNKLNYFNTPIFSLLVMLQQLNTDIFDDELYERVEEFECIKDGKLDLVSINSLFDFYETPFKEDIFRRIKGYEIY